MPESLPATGTSGQALPREGPGATLPERGRPCVRARGAAEPAFEPEPAVWPGAIRSVCASGPRPALAATGSGGGHTRAPGSRGGGRTLRGSARESPGGAELRAHLLPPRLGLPRALRARRPNGALQRGFRRRAARGLRDPPRQSRLAPARARTREPAGRVRRRDRDHTATELPADVLPAGTACQALARRRHGARSRGRRERRRLDARRLRARGGPRGRRRYANRVAARDALLRDEEQGRQPPGLATRRPHRLLRVRGAGRGGGGRPGRQAADAHRRRRPAVGRAGVVTRRARGLGQRAGSRRRQLPAVGLRARRSPGGSCSTCREACACRTSPPTGACS